MPANQRVGFVKTATIYGIDALPVTVEISIGSGLPGFYIIGLPDLAVKEATRRVRQALKSTGFVVKNAQVIVNLAPSSMRKIGSGFDLPIALAYLQATNQIDEGLTANRICVGELSLDGTIRAVSGQLAYERLAQQRQMGLLTAPVRAGLVIEPTEDHLCLESLAALKTARFTPAQQSPASPETRHLDFADIVGNDLAKRALQIAAAGSFGLLMIGPPGAGKSMMARRLPSILPPLEEANRLDSALIHSVAGLPFDSILSGERPFRAPHHGASRAGLIGGGNPILPGEISLAHNGVLFLDELPEFGSAALQLLRQPIELGYISLARAQGTVTFPAQFMLVAAANPCPCGFLSDEHHSCSCTPAQISRYLGRVGGPLLDRFNLVVDVTRTIAADVLATGQGTTSASLRAGVKKARAFARWRQLQDPTDGLSNVTNLKSQEAALLAACQLGSQEQALLEMVADRYFLSGRGIISTLAVARTIADMDEQLKVQKHHLFEAIGYRPRGDQ
ncbi:MAG: YifB family Mg chelatase-like AAA ATPase [Coriobacteriales bacterium]|jgi:magnesium chelatase family protein|nr:YifB family Mg chelatase-like AAA ATPase [Coriobacteriales bacterium]